VLSVVAVSNAYVSSISLVDRLRRHRGVIADVAKGIQQLAWDAL
jgi:hypothetical protein